MATTSTPKHVAVIGGGISGVTLAYLLTARGLKVTVYERQGMLGGLATYIDFQGARLDRFYHTILTSDMSMHHLIEESGVGDRLHFTPTRQGFFDAGMLHSFDSPLDLLRFPPLSLFGRFRLGLQILYSQLESDWRKMDTVPVEQWLLRVSGRQVFEKVWNPLLRAKFDTLPIDSIPATYIWSRLHRMMNTRQGVTSQEMMCYLEGGYYTLIEAMIARSKAQGAVFKTNTTVDEIIINDGHTEGIRIGAEQHLFDAVISTLPSPIMTQIAPQAPTSFLDLLTKQEYLGVVCPLLIMDRQLTPYYVLNITDETIPFTAVVETTNLIDPVYVGGNHLVYLPKYIASGNDVITWTNEQIEAEWLKHFRRMFPNFESKWMRAFLVQRARIVEPLRPIGTADQVPTIRTPVERLYLSNSAMVYPDLNNGESITRQASKVANIVVSDLVSEPASTNAAIADPPVSHKDLLSGAVK